MASEPCRGLGVDAFAALLIVFSPAFTYRYED